MLCALRFQVGRSLNLDWWRRLRSVVGERRGTRAFNCAEQDTETWLQRADVAAALVAQLDPPPRSIADIGCGDQKLRLALSRRGVSIHYQGFDLLPQSVDVRAFDVRDSALGEAFDTAAVLGVLEYIDDVAAALKNVARQTSSVVVSYAAFDVHALPPEKRARRGWRSTLTADEFEACLDTVGLDVLERRSTPDLRTNVWLGRVSERVTVSRAT